MSGLGSPVTVSSASVHAAGWDKSDLEDRVCRVLDVGIDAVTRLALDGYVDPEEPQNSLRPEKLISETAVLLYFASIAEPDRHCAVGTRIHTLAQLLIPHARSDRMRMGLCLEPSLALDFGEAHACLSKMGYQDAGFDELLQQSINSQAASGRERVPHRMLQQSWICDVWAGSAPSTRKIARVNVANSALNHPMDLFGGGRHDVYAFTHAVMYVSGLNGLNCRLPRARSIILAEAESALAGCLDEEDYDLAGEILMAWPLTGKSWSPASIFAFRVLARVEEIGGVLPALSTRQLRLDKLQGDERADYFLATAYHTAYVMGLLCSVALRPGHAPPARLKKNDTLDDSVGRILEILDADGRSRHWRLEFDRLCSGERGQLANFLLNIALFRAAKHRSFDAIHELLELGHRYGLTDSPAASQAAEMLQRVALFADRRALNNHGISPLEKRDAQSDEHRPYADHGSSASGNKQPPKCEPPA